MANSGKVLLITDYFGVLHITPLGNKNFYVSRNAKNDKYKFVIREMSPEEAEGFVKQHEGRDPDFIKVGEANKMIADKNAKIKELEAELARLRPATADNDIIGIDIPPLSDKVTATELIDKINAASTSAEIDELVDKDETRKTVINAAKVKLESFSKKQL
jgi:hypothetical protein